MKRLMIFVDHSNIYTSAINKGIKINWPKFASYLAESGIDQYDLTRVIMYCTLDGSLPEEKRKKQENAFSLFDSFFKFDVKLFNLNVDGDRRNEKMVDVAIAVDLVLFASRNAYDVAILCSGDADFIPAVDAVMELGKEIYVAGFESTSSIELRKASLGYIFLDDVESIRLKAKEFDESLYENPRRDQDFDDSCCSPSV